MRSIRMGWLLTAPLAVAAAGLAALDACTDQTNDLPTAVGGGDSGKGGGGDDSSAPPAPPGPPGDDAGDAGNDCGKAPSLHPPKDGSTDFFCVFGTNGDGGQLYCPLSETCCEAPKGSTTTCETGKKQTCPVSGSTSWQCLSPQDCPGANMRCCAYSGDGGAVTVMTDTCGPFLSKFDGTKCSATACGTGELTVCEQPSDCPTGACTAVKPKSNDIGVCN